MRIKGLWAPHDPAPELFSPAPSCLQSELSAISWQEWQGSNLRPPVLETGALPIELHSCRELALPPVRAVSSIGHARNARAKRLRRPTHSILSAPPSHKQQKHRERP